MLFRVEVHCHPTLTNNIRLAAKGRSIGEPYVSPDVLPDLGPLVTLPVYAVNTVR